MPNARNEYGLWMERPRDFHRALPQYRLNVSRWPGRQMEKLKPWRDSTMFSVRQHCAPARAETTFQDGESKEHQASVLPGSFLQSITGDSDQAAGFRFQLINAATDELLFESDVASGELAGAAVAPFNQPGPCLLPDGGLPFPHGGQIIIRRTNMAAVSARCQLVLWIAEPLGGLL
jgi:hypothetical protein